VLELGLGQIQSQPAPRSYLVFENSIYRNGVILKIHITAEVLTTIRAGSRAHFSHLAMLAVFELARVDIAAFEFVHTNSLDFL